MKTESVVAEGAGLSRTRIRLLRKEALTEGVHWHREDSGMVVYTQAGVEALAAVLKKTAQAAVVGEQVAEGLTTGAESSEEVGGVACFVGGADPVPFEKAAAPVEAVVSRWQFKNAQIIEAKTADGQTLMVRVRESKNYRPGMKIRVDVQRPGHGIAVGRAPRYPGRW